MQPPEQTKTSPDPATLPGQIAIRRADIAGFRRVWGWPIHLVMGILFLLTLPVGIAFLPIAFYTFWVLLATVAHLRGVPADQGWPLIVALGLGVLAAAGLTYLLQDRIALMGNRRVRQALWDKAVHVLGTPLPSARYFVQMKAVPRWTRSHGGSRDDVGWLVVYPERLEFVGDRLLVTLPRGAIASLKRGPDLARLGLGGSWLEMEMESPDDGTPTALRVLSRDGDHVSETGEAARALERILSAWRTSPART